MAFFCTRMGHRPSPLCRPADASTIPWEANRGAHPLQISDRFISLYCNAQLPCCGALKKAWWVRNRDDQRSRFMSKNNAKTWNTKYGRRRVRNDVPTLDEAIAAAQGLADEIDAQVEIAASLIGLSHDEVRPALLKAAPLREVPTASIAFAGPDAEPRAVVVERKPSRRTALTAERTSRPALSSPRKVIVESLRPRSRLGLSSKA